MLMAVLQTIFKLGVIFELALMVLCTVFVVSCIIHGEIRIEIVINEITRNETEKKNE